MPFILFIYEYCDYMVVLCLESDLLKDLSKLRLGHPKNEKTLVINYFFFAISV